MQTTRATYATLGLGVAAAVLFGGSTALAQQAYGRHPDTRVGTEPAVRAQLVPSSRHPFAGEVFDVSFVVGLSGNQRGEVADGPARITGTVVAESWAEGQRVRLSDGSGVRYQTRALVPQPGTVTLEGVTQDVVLRTGRDSFADLFASNRFPNVLSDSFFDSFFDRGTSTTVTAHSAPVTLEVRPLPEPREKGFTGAVGTFAIDTTLVPAEVSTGEPVTWTLALRGTGNWPGGVTVPARSVPMQFRSLQPKQHREFAGNDLFTGAVSEDLVLIPTQPGAYQLEPISFVYFDPAKQRYETIVAEVPPLRVTGQTLATTQPPASHAGTITSDPNGAAGAAPPAGTGTTNATASFSADLLPRDPLTEAGVGRTPLPAASLLAVLLIPLCGLATFWLALAVSSAQRTDPRRAGHEALRQLRTAVAQVHRARTPSERAAALLAWQRAVVALLGIGRAVPTVKELEAVSGRPDHWSPLWRASEQALYAPQAELPPNWCEEALAVYRTAGRHWFNPLRAFLPRNLLPAALTGALLLCAAGAQGSGDPLDAYRNGDFQAAAQGWQEQLDAQPGDWAARYNLGLASAQLGNRPAALAHTAGAFLMAPRDEHVRWNLATFSRQTPAADRRLQHLASGMSLARLARLAAPATWQVWLVVGVCLLAVAVALRLRRAYAREVTTSARWAARLSVVLGAALSVAAGLAMYAYGPLGNPAVAMVIQEGPLRSIPTAAQDGQEQRQLAAGTVVVVDKNFLGWRRVALPSGETGWLRSDSLSFLYPNSQA
jgi:hypothetical protein